MQLTSINFYIFLFTVVGIYSLIDSSIYRNWILAIANSLFIISYLDNLRDGWALFGFILLGYALVIGTPVNKKTYFSVVYCFIIIICFLVLKKYILPKNWVNYCPYFTTIGLSYILFRVLHMIIDKGEGEIDVCPSFVSYLSYVTFFPSFLCGPIHRYEEFTKQVRSNLRPKDFVNKRLLVGLTKTLIIAPGIEKIFYTLSFGVYPGQTETGFHLEYFTEPLSFLMRVSLSAASYLLFLYYNFSGYTDIAISISIIFGIHLPENFDRPFTASNVSEFWARWHMSLSEWIKAYIFNPILSYLLRRFPNKSTSMVISNIVLFFVFFIVGIWHGAALSYVYFGIYLGLCAVIHRLYNYALIRYFDKNLVRSFQKNTFYIYFCRGLTFAYFSIGLICLTLSSEGLKEFFIKIGIVNTGLIFIILTLISGLIMVILDIINDILEHVKNKIHDFISSYWLSDTSIVFYTLLILIFGTQFDFGSSFVYQIY